MSSTPRRPSKESAASSTIVVVSPQPTQRRRLSAKPVPPTTTNPTPAVTGWHTDEETTTWASIVKQSPHQEKVAATAKETLKSSSSSSSARPKSEADKIKDEMSSINRQIDEKLGIKDRKAKLPSRGSSHRDHHGSFSQPPMNCRALHTASHCHPYPPPQYHHEEEVVEDEAVWGFEDEETNPPLPEYQDPASLTTKPAAASHHYHESVSNKPLWPTTYPRGGEYQHCNMFSPAILKNFATGETLLGYHHSPYDVDVFPAYWLAEDEGEYLYPPQGRELPLSVRHYQEEEERSLSTNDQLLLVEGIQEELEGDMGDDEVAPTTITTTTTDVLKLPPRYEEAVVGLLPEYSADVNQHLPPPRLFLPQNEEPRRMEMDEEEVMEEEPHQIGEVPPQEELSIQATPLKQKTVLRPSATDPTFCQSNVARCVSPLAQAADEPQTLPSTPRGQQQGRSANFSFPMTDAAEFSRQRSESNSTTAQISPLAASTEAPLQLETLVTGSLPRTVQKVSDSGEHELIFHHQGENMNGAVDEQEEERELLLDQIVITSIKFRPRPRTSVASTAKAPAFHVPLPRSKIASSLKQESSPLTFSKLAKPLPSIDHSPAAAVKVSQNPAEGSIAKEQLQVPPLKAKMSKKGGKGKVVRKA